LRQICFMSDNPYGGVEAMRKREFHVIIERDSEGYCVASVPELPGCHTQAKSLDALMKRSREAIELCLEVEKYTPMHFGLLRRICG
jgi:predicted RNase H-like HicB family nuclease